MRYWALYQSPASGTSVWSPKTCGEAGGRAAYQSYVKALTGLFGQPRTVVSSAGTDDECREAIWYLPNESSFRLSALPGIIDVDIHSPQSTLNDLEDQRLTAKYGEGWEDRLD